MIIGDQFIIGDPATGGFNGGVNYAGSNNDLAPNESPECWNYLVNEAGLVKRAGSLKDNDTELVAGTGITGLHRFYNGTEYKTFVKCGTSVYDLAATGTSSTIATSLIDTDEITFESWFSHYFFSDGKDLYTGTTGAASKVTFLDQYGAALTGEKPKGKVIFLHNQRLIMIGDGSKIYHSETDFYDRWEVSEADKTLLNCWDACDKDDGMNLVGGVSYNGKILAWKPNKMFILSGDWAFDNVSLTRVAMVGAYDHKSIIDCPDGFVRWYGPDGVWQYSDATGLQKISLKIQNELNKITPTNRTKVCAGWWNGLYILSYPYGDTATYCNRLLAYDTARGCWMPLRGWNISRFVTFEDGTLHGGWSNAGYVKKLFTGLHDDGQDIEASYRTIFYISLTQRCLDKLKVSILAGDGGTTITWVTDLTSGSIVNPPTPSLGDKLADRNNLAAGGFMLSDQIDAPNFTGSLLVDRNDIKSQGPRDFKPRLRPGNLFNKIQFTFYEKSMSAHQIDFMEVDSISMRRV